MKSNHDGGYYTKATRIPPSRPVQLKRTRSHIVPRRSVHFLQTHTDFEVHRPPRNPNCKRNNNPGNSGTSWSSLRNRRSIHRDDYRLFRSLGGRAISVSWSRCYSRYPQRSCHQPRCQREEVLCSSTPARGNWHLCAHTIYRDLCRGELWEPTLAVFLDAPSGLLRTCLSLV